MQAGIVRSIIVCALGYLIDIFDIQLFSVLRVPSLTALGVPADQLTSVGGYMLNAQMLGMVMGAFLWGWIGDKWGRVRSLYGSILLYSIGSLACGFVADVPTYGFLRFITGFGVAGEVGAAITLIAEIAPAKTRNWFIVAVSGIGFLGPVIAVLVSWFVPWRETYMIAGLLGFGLLVARFNLQESPLFQRIRNIDIGAGDLRILTQSKRSHTMVYCLMIGGPLIYAWLLLNFFSAEFSRLILGPNDRFDQKVCLLAFYIGACFGDVLSGIASELLHSRRKACAAMLVLGMLSSLTLMLLGPTMKLSVDAFYAAYFIIGTAGGCWVLQTAICAEQFGTNIRATTTIVLTNIARALSIPMIFAFQALQAIVQINVASALIGAVLYAAAFIALGRLRETHRLDLDYIESTESA
jgi:putative MFS transporter